MTKGVPFAGVRGSALALHFIGNQRRVTEYCRQMTDQILPSIVGYARVSSADQTDDGQVDALRRAGSTRVVTETASGVTDRPVLDSLVETLGPGDTLAVTEVSRLGRTTARVLLLADDLIVRGIHLRILNLGIDTGTPAGGLVLTMMAGLARFERELLRERQRRGIDAARARGKHLGRPRCSTTAISKRPFAGWRRRAWQPLPASGGSPSGRCPGSSTGMRAITRLSGPAARGSASGGDRFDTGSTDMDDLLVATFEAHNPERNHHRWYRVRVGRDLFGYWTVYFGYGRVGQAGQSIRYGGASAVPFQEAVRDCLLRRLSAPQRLGCEYTLGDLSAADGFDVASWLPQDILARFVVVRRPAAPEPAATAHRVTSRLLAAEQGVS